MEINFGPAIQFANGNCSTIALMAVNGVNKIITAYNSLNDGTWEGLAYSVGVIDDDTNTIQFTTPTVYTTGAQAPFLALLDDDDTNNIYKIIEANMGGGAGPLFYMIGTLQVNNSISFTPQIQYVDNDSLADCTAMTVIPINNNLNVIEVHRNYMTQQLFYNVGVAGKTTIGFSPSATQYSTGDAPFISTVQVNNNYQFIEAHSFNNNLYYSVGELEGNTLMFYNQIQYGFGTSPSIIELPGSKLLEIHSANDGSQNLFYSFGELQDDNTILFDPAVQYGSGIAAQAIVYSTDTGVKIIETHFDTSTNIYYRIGTIQYE